LVFHRTVTIIKINTITNIIKLYHDDHDKVNIGKALKKRTYFLVQLKKEANFKENEISDPPTE